MFAIGPIAFSTPFLLLGLIGLPILWLILRAVPPAPIRRKFPGVALLLGLRDREVEADKTPWWLLLLRALAMAAIIIGFSGPVLNPENREARNLPLLVLTDSSWASARDWIARRDRITEVLTIAGRTGRLVALVQLTDLPKGGAEFAPASRSAQRAAGLQPNAWEPDLAAVSAWAKMLDGPFDTLWFSDGIARAGAEDLAAQFQSFGSLRIVAGNRTLTTLRPPTFQDGMIAVNALRSPAGGVLETTLVVRGPDPNDATTDLARVPMTFAAGDETAAVLLDLPSELRNRITRFQLEGQSHAGAVSLADDSLRRREIALFTGRDGSEGLELLDPLHFLRRALAPNADLLELPLQDVLLANPDAIILADVANLAAPEQQGLTTWVKNGGLLLRFAGPRLAASDVARADEAPLLPVRLRAGGRSVGGAMSWGAPKTLRPFAEGSPFYGLQVPQDVQVSAQVMAQPDPDLPERVIAALTDGTPVVTRKSLGQGQIVLVHVTANAEWSTLPLSGLFVQMLDRLAVSSRPAKISDQGWVGTSWIPRQQLNAFGGLEGADTLAAVSGKDLANASLSARIPPGLYEGSDRVLARNVIDDARIILPAKWPAGVTVEGLAAPSERPLAGAVLVFALGLLALDIIATLALSGRLSGARAMIVVVAGLCAMPHVGVAQSKQDEDTIALLATSEVVLGHVITGDTRADEIAFAGLRGLGATLSRRTSIEPAAPMSVDLETDELSFFPFLYWPISAKQNRPSDAAYGKLNRYLRGGGMIMFDTRDADLAAFDRDTDGVNILRRLAGPLDVPPLDLLPGDHVLTRSFYLLQDFPGRHAGRDVWVEAAPAESKRAEGVPFRTLNDGVTPVVIGGNDWASAWAVDAQGRYLFPIGRGRAGHRQREMALRFGVNLIMHVLTGNYKSDQVHVPALLDRLGQ